MADIVIDTVQRRDLPDLYRLYEQLTEEPGDFAAMRAGFDAIAANPAYWLAAARRDGDLVGSAMAVVCVKLSRDCRPFLVMENFVVASRCRRQGVGATLMRAVERHAVERDCGSIMFISSGRRPQAHAFYAALGYEPDAVRGFRKLLPRREGAGDPACRGREG